MRYPLFLLIASALLWTGCASNRHTRAEAQEKLIDPVDTCSVVVEENQIITDSIQPEKTLKLRQEGGFMLGYRRCYTSRGVRYYAKKNACEEGYSFVHLYNIVEPTIWGGPCAMADADLYRTIPQSDASPLPVLRFDTIPNSGLQLFATLGLGGVMSGTQKNTGLVPRPSVNKTSLGVSAEYYWNRIGLEGDFDYFGNTSAVKEKHKPMDLYNTLLFRTGVAGTLWQKTGLVQTLKLDASAGGNYVLIKVDDEYADFLSSYGSVIRSWGGGFGYYGKLKLKMIMPSGFSGYAGVKYEFENPKLEGAYKALDAHTFQALMAIGYKF